MTSASTRYFSEVFDQISSDYDKHRPGYPTELIDCACKIADLESGDKVLEIGCGSGQLTRSLVERGYHVTALEPGENLISLAQQNVKGPGKVEFLHTKFEDVALPNGNYKAVFSASAFHWVDPDISWQKTADLLMPGGVFALMQYFGLKQESTARDLAMLQTALKKIAPTIAASWSRYYELDEIIKEAEKRRNNVSELWSWLGDYDLNRAYVGQLFSKAQLVSVPHIVEQTADQLTNLIRTLSMYSRLNEQQRTELAHEYKEIFERLGRPIRSSTVGVLVTASRE